MAAPALPPPFQSLDDQPRLNFAEFERQVIDDAGSVCLDIFPHGLLSFVVSDNLWQTLPNNTNIIDGVLAVLPRDLLLQPPQPADNAGAGLCTQHSLIRGNGFLIPGIPKTTKNRTNEIPVPAVEVLYIHS